MMKVITSKKCSMCKQVLPIGDFAYRADRGVYRTECRDCKRNADRQTYQRKHGVPARPFYNTYDYRAENEAFRGWGIPGMGTRVPDLGMPVGLLSPSLGLVLGVAA